MPFINELLQFCKNQVFVETGSYKGDTLQVVLNQEFPPSDIISLELSTVFFNDCKKRFENEKRVSLHHCNSKYDLYDVIKSFDKEITFWLDSHWSGVPDIACDPVTICPVIEELIQIEKHHIKTHTIMVDDIRLMGESFPCTLEQILSHIFKINPNYIIQYYDDFTSKKDVLVAYIREKHCIHSYLTTCKTNPHPPGFGDFVRGTVQLYNFCKTYNYDLLIDCEHPCFTALRPNKNLIYRNKDREVLEFLPPVSYNDIYNNLEHIFNLNQSFCVMTNSFVKDANGYVTNLGYISDDCRSYLNDILQPSDEVKINMDYIFKNIYKMNMNDSFKVINLRCGDDYLYNNKNNDEYYDKYYEIICRLVNNNQDTNYILISDSSYTANKLKNNIPKLYYWDNCKIHLGSLRKDMSISVSVIHTMTDFFIMSKAKEIISTSSGFSRTASMLNNIPYTIIY
jgi:hypothetical protein